MKIKSLDNNTCASTPGKVTMSMKKLRKLRPDLFGLSGLIKEYRFNKQNGFTEKKHIKEHLMYGDSQPAIVISANPLIIAAYTEDIDCVVLLSFPYEYAINYNLEKKSRLITVNTYLRLQCFQKDLLPGRRCHNTWTGFSPFVAEFMTNDHAILEKHKSEISDELWQYAYDLGVMQLTNYPRRIRNGIPGLSEICVV